MIGVIGGFGDIGSRVVKYITKYSNHNIRIGGRSEHKIPSGYSNKISFQQVDIQDEASLSRYIEGCEVVINCTGIGKDKAAVLQAVIVKKSVNYISLDRYDWSEYAGMFSGRNAVIDCCGSIPGLAETLMVYMCNRFKKIEKLKFYYGALGKFTITAARDYLLGLDHTTTKSMVYLRDGKVSIYPHLDMLEEKLPFLESSFRLFPYVDEGALYVAEKFHIQDAVWYMTIAGDRTLKALEDTSRSARKLSIASELDCNELGTFAGYLIEVTGNEMYNNVTKTLYLRFNHPSALTAFVTTVSALGICEGVLGPGIYPLYLMEDIEEYVQYLNKFEDVFRICVVNGNMNSFMKMEEYEL